MEKHDVKYGKSISEAVEEINDKKKKGEKVHPMTEKGLQAIEIANMVVGTIMKRNQPDVGFFKLYMENTNKQINSMSSDKEKAAGTTRRSLKRKRSRRSDRVNDGDNSA